MPELPEVETVRRGLEPHLVGQRFRRVIQRRPDLRWPFPKRFAERLEGQAVTALRRRAKYILAELSSREVLILHLGMSGRLSVAEPGNGPARILGDYIYDPGSDPHHDHVVFEMQNGTSVTFNDPRRFGCMDLVAEDKIESHKLMKELGPEPLANSFNAQYLAKRAAGRSADLKAFLMDQKTVAGLGNIYVCEALHRAGLSPSRKASCLALASGKPTDRAERLVSAIRDVLNEAIAAGGSTLRDYRKTDGGKGSFQETFFVYDREGEACLRKACGGIVKRKVQGGRSTFYCGACQR